jgi:hypothetical protein
MRTGHPVLPGTKPKPPAMPFRIGQRVKMRACPDSPPGTVVGLRRNKLLIQWHDLGYTGRHHPSALMLAEDSASEGGK